MLVDLAMTVKPAASMLFVVSALLSACTGVAPVPQGGAALKVATWNLEHLAELNAQGCRPRKEADYALLRRHADALGADVIALQEIENQTAAERVFEPEKYDVVMSTRPAGERGPECRGLPGRHIQNQAVGFAIRKGVAWSRNDDLSALALGNPNLRWGVDITVANGRPLRLLAVHLKSGCNSGRASTDPDCPVLFDQLPVLEAWVDDRAQAGEAFGFRGYCTRRWARRGFAFSEGLIAGDRGAASLTLAGGDRSAACKARYREFIDFIVVGVEAAKRLEPGSFEEYVYDAPEADHPSDHCPISVRLRR